MKIIATSALLAMSVMLVGAPASAQSFRVQCPAITALHPGRCSGGTNAGQACQKAPDCPDATGSCLPMGASVDPAHPGQIKCQHVGGGDGFATMGDGHQIYLFAFSPLSGLADIEAGKPGTSTADVFNAGYLGPNYSTVGAGTCSGGTNAGEPCRALSECPDRASSGVACTLPSGINVAATPNNGAITEPAGIMDMGILAGNAPAPMMAIDEDDEFFLTLSNPGMIMRPDLFEQHTVHFHGYPNASSYFDGVPDASVAINIAGSFTYYYTAPDAGTYFWHCHITPPEHLQMGMVGQLYVRPRQNRLNANQSLRDALIAGNRQAAVDPLATGMGCSDLLCTGQTPVPPPNAATGGARYAYNDGDGSTRYDVEYPIQMMGFDPNFHYVGMTFNPEAFADMKDKYFLLSGRSYPDTVAPGPISTLSADGVSRPSQPVPALIKIDKSAGQTRALLRISDLSVTEFTTLATIGIPMKVIAQNARLLRDLAGNNLYYDTNSITLGGGESADVLLDATDVPQGTYFLYSTNLDHLSNDAENFGGMMTEIQVN
ncbi:MAG TPA: multicopper oxidase domain-containing protein [Myxococcales bacterium]